MNWSRILLKIPGVLIGTIGAIIWILLRMLWILLVIAPYRGGAYVANKIRKDG